MTLYFVYFAKIVKAVSTELLTVKRAIALVFLPTILMILSYSLLYLQLEKQMKLSRIQSGQMFMRRFKPDKVEKVREIVVFTAVACYIVSQVIILILAALDKVQLDTFQVELVICSAVFMIVVNVSQIVIYFNLTGSPYKS